MTKTSETVETFEKTKEKTQEFMTTHIANSEKMVESLIEFNAAVFKGGEAMAKKMYENYVSNVAATFDGVKALNKASDMTEFFKVATSTMAASADRLTEQSKAISELATKVAKETSEAGRLAYSKGFTVSL